jgi:hypothetical protein
LRQAAERLKIGESSPLIETRFGFHILKLIERDKGGQKDLSSAQVQAQIRQAIFSQKEQMLKAAFSEVARNKAQVNNYLAERLLESAGKTSTTVGKDAKAETKADEKKDEKKEEAKAPEKAADSSKEPAKK